ncbi:MAG: RNA polymerase sigma factor [Acidobacteria bacterium]|nr:RNA polymerase sigma factor [Acidobacteriota bacterium]MCK6682765.1 RNA polymerase sigma factor [Thermoanaerobaculia bacterium]
MVAYQGGDAVAFERLYDEVAGPLLGYLRSLTRDAARAEDLLQETFFHVHRARHTYDPTRSARAWLYAIAHNVFLMYRRASKRLGKHEDLADEELPEVPIPAEMEGLAERDLLRRALAQLPEDRREAVVLHHIQGLSFAEIGAVSGVSAGAAKLRAHRGMVEMREFLRTAGGSAR